MDPGEHYETLYLCFLDGELYQCNNIHCYMQGRKLTLFQGLVRNWILYYTTLHYTILTISKLMIWYRS